MRELTFPEFPPDLWSDAASDTAPWVLAVALLAAVAMFWLARRARRNYLALPELAAIPEAAAEDHCVIIPARNEERTIARCVASFPDSLRVVVDDHSSDGTAPAAAGAGAEVRKAPPLASAVRGKPNTCAAGAELTESKWILFADADSSYDPAFLPSLLTVAAREELHCATVFPRRELDGWCGKALLPYAFGLRFTAVSAAEVNNPRHPEALANGQCLLVLRKSYDFVGGHRAVASKVLEDLALARILKRHRMKIRVMRCETMARAAMPGSPVELWRELERTSCRFLLGNGVAGAAAAGAALVMASWLPLLAGLAWAGLWLPAAAYVLVPAAAWRPWYGSWPRALAAPLAIYAFMLIALSSAGKAVFGLTTEWKGRRV